MMDYLKHYPELKDLDTECTLRVNHAGCASTGSSRSLSFTRKEHGYIYRCFKCDESGWIPSTDVSLRPVKRGGVSAEKGGITNPPRTAVQDPFRFPPKISAWIRKYLTVEEIQDHGIMADDRLRLWFPISPSGWVYRNFDGGPKWYTKVRHGCGIYGGPDSSCAVVVEDTVSGIVCSRHCDSYALLGTTVHDSVLRTLAARRYKRLIVFLDDDNSIVKAQQQKAKRRLELVCSDVRIHHSSGCDPKDHSEEELKIILGGTV